MDFTKLQGMSNDMNEMRLSPEEKYLRKSIYIIFANADMLGKLYTDVLVRFKKYISTNLLQQKYDKDILYSFFNDVEYASTMKEQKRITLNVKIYSRPLLPAISIPPSLKISHQTLTKMNNIGYQHLYILSAMTDTSESSNTNTSDSDSDNGVPLKKKLKTCQKAIEVNCNSMLEPHIENTTGITGTTVHVDILIFMDKKFSKQLSDYLGLIYAEAVLEEAEEKDINVVLFRLKNKSANLYKLIQSYINKYLINGYNNICIVNHLSLWEKFNANVRAVISTDTQNVTFMKAVKTTNFHVKLGEQISLLDYVESISVIIDKVLNFESHVIAKYKCEENCYRNVKLPLVSIIPLYILRYFRHCRILEQDVELD